MMQTALAIREVMMKFVDVLLYVAVYFGGVVIMVAGADWRLALPFGGWLIGYIALLKYFLPRLQAIAEAQANARAEMTGRVVDAYTNIGTVKLFAHTTRESDYARASMQSFLTTVYTQMRRINGFYASLYLLNALLLFSVTGLGIVFWSERAITAGAVATAVGLVLQINGMSQWIMWEVSNLFEHIGTIRDGMGSFTSNRAIVDTPDAAPLQVSHGAIAFEDISFHYGRDDAGVISNFSLSIAPGEKIGLVGRSGAGKSTLLALLLRFHELESGRITIDGQDITGVTQASLREAIGMVTQDTALLHRSIARQHPLRSPGCDRRRAPGRDRGRPCRVRARPHRQQGPPRARRPRWRTRRETLRRPAPARRTRPRHAQECAHSAARRSHRRAGFRNRSRHHRKPARHHGRQDRDRRRPSAVHHRRTRSSGGDRQRRHRGNRHAWRIARAQTGFMRGCGRCSPVGFSARSAAPDRYK